MSNMETTLSDEELVSEVRDSLAGIDSAKIPDATIKQTKERFVEPLLNEVTGANPDQEKFDNAIIAWTAEKSFDAWMSYSRMRDSGIEFYTDPQNYQENLKERTDNALYLLDAMRPPQTPNKVVTVKHDGVERNVHLSSHDSTI